MASAAITAKSSATARKDLLKYNNHGHRNKVNKLLTFGIPLGSPTRYLCHHCQPLNEASEEMDPGSTLSGYSDSLNAPELPWSCGVVPAFPQVLNQSLLQAVT